MIFQDQTFTLHKQKLKAMLLIYLISTIFLISNVEGDQTTLCINFPHVKYKDEHLKSMGIEKFPQNKGIWTRFEDKVENGIISIPTLPQVLHMYSDKVSGYPAGDLSIFRVKNGNDYLNGWFRIRFRLKYNEIGDDFHKMLKVFLLYVRDDQFRRQNIGEFVWNFPTKDVVDNQCPSNDATKYMVISCGGASKSEPLVSNMIVLVQKDDIYSSQSKDLKLIPELRKKKELNFYVRIPIQDCNQKKKIVFQARVIIDKTTLSHARKEDIAAITTTWFEIEPGKIPGIADPLPTPSKANDLNCNEEITGNTVPWYAVSNKQNDGRDTDEIQYLTACQGNHFSGRCSNNFYDMFRNSYGGISEQKRHLREIVNQNVATDTAIPICEHQIPKRSAPDNFNFKDLRIYVKPTEFNGKVSKFVNTHEYLRDKGELCGNLYKGNSTCSVTKMVPNGRTRGSIGEGKSGQLKRKQYQHHHRSHHHHQMGRKLVVNIERMDGAKRSFVDISSTHVKTEDDLKLLKFWDKLTEEEKNTFGVPFEDVGFTLLIWAMRQGHSLCMSIVALLFMPVNLFVTRYYKETFMDKRIMLSRVWYQVHVHGVFIIGGLIIASLIPIWVSSGYLGSSLTTAAKWHRGLGWSTIGIFFLLMIFGGIRGYKDPLRKITIFLHWLFGTIFYILIYLLMMNSVFIPGNGVTSSDQSYMPIIKNDDASSYSSAYMHIWIWIIFEILMHTIMTFNMIALDKRLGVHDDRKYLPVMIPVVKEHSTDMTPGHGLRVITLTIYVGFAFLSCFLYFIISVENTTWELKGLGPMTCTHDSNTLKLNSSTINC